VEAVQEAALLMRALARARARGWLKTAAVRGCVVVPMRPATTGHREVLSGSGRAAVRASSRIALSRRAVRQPRQQDLYRLRAQRARRHDSRGLLRSRATGTGVSMPVSWEMPSLKAAISGRRRRAASVVS
jgi:hypothetical protein